MGAEILPEIEHLIHGSPLRAVDIRPLLEQYADGMALAESEPIRLEVVAIIGWLKAQGDNELSPAHNSDLPKQHTGRESNRVVIYIAGTVQFELRYSQKYKVPLPPIVHDIVQFGRAYAHTLHAQGMNADLATRRTQIHQIPKGRLQYWIAQNPALAKLTIGIIVFTVFQILIRLGAIH